MIGFLHKGLDCVEQLKAQKIIVKVPADCSKDSAWATKLMTEFEAAKRTIDASRIKA